MFLTTHRRLLAGTALLFASAAVHAQTAPAPDTQDAQQDERQQRTATADAASSAEAQGNDIVVTGSRITRSEFAAPNPITSFNAAAIQQSGNTNITSFLERVPALSGSRDFTQTSGGNAVYSNPFGAAGLNELNLRNLGVNRTLVLVNGRRHVAGEPNSAAVDINSIPTDLIERVDVLTGGASAVYGADGVSGVVNFILKRDFNGISARSQVGISSRGDAGNRFASIAAGKTFANGRANLTVAYEYNADDRLENDDRAYLRSDRRQYLIPNDAAAANPSLPHNVLVGDLRYPNESPIGAVDVNGDGYPDFNGYGQPYRHGTSAAYYSTGGDDTPVAGFYSGDLAPRIVRHDVNVLGHYDVSDALKLSIEGKYAQTRATTYDYYIGTYGTAISLENPFVPAAIRDAALAAGQTSVAVTRDNLDYGRHGESDLRRTYRGVIDAGGRISDQATYDVYYEYGRTDVAITKLNDILSDRYAAAIDVVANPATGQPVCRSNLTGTNSGCLPVNLFGPGPIDSQALSFFQIDDTSYARITQQVANASVSGDFGAFFKLPGGPVQFSFGGEYRRETSAFNPSDNLIANRFAAFTEPTLVVPSGGSFDVKEAFGELNAPLLKAARFAETLSVGAAYRFSNYSTIGNTDTWQVNGVYAPVRDITFRGSYGRSVRAPNIGELFQPISGDSNFFIDPCAPGELIHGTQYRAANCKAALAAVGATISDALQTPNNIAGVRSGNPNLRAETATTWTAGVVLRPSFLHGLTASFDWYDIDLKGAINTPAPSQLATLCVDQPTIDNQFCRSLTRASGTGIINGYTVEPQNVAQFRTAGADMNLDYLIHTARIGTIDLRLVGGYLHRLEFVGTPGAPATDNVDQPGAPKFNFTISPSWTVGVLTLSYNLRWADATRTVDKLTTDNDPDYAPAAQLRYSELWQHDLQVGVNLPSGFSFYVGAQNLTGQKPDAGNAINQPISAVGRYLYAGVKINTGGR
ncbi:TonB-dependent receptor plug domain-containing protein [Sphingomonas sp. BAUL-RG-20F-R05-02]|uniref:TonB-dependent receptor plug domain-containing protein n=1 Tax=Sphingomonas sp. BAUL-RG-20F-R05-02 TaxID=2914830 RepID=UPI001F5944EF|nr:TonB-dependent receptor [Sphingomonas sp. BAUL-RG-20F-R05-02]